MGFAGEGGLEGKVDSARNLRAYFAEEDSGCVELGGDRIQRRQTRGDEVSVYEITAAGYAGEILQGEGCLACPVGACNDVTSWFSLFFHNNSKRS